MAVLSELDRQEVPGVRWSRPEQWMVKVRALGHVDDRTVPLLIDALEAELDGAPPVECVLGPAPRRIGGQWLGAPVAGLDELAAVVFEATEGLVPVTHPEPFQADIVLARGRVPKELAGRPVSAWLSTSSGVSLAEFAEPSFDRLEGHLGRIELSLGRAEWSSRLIDRELRKTR
jgi:hypothetical protein